MEFDTPTDSAPLDDQASQKHVMGKTNGHRNIPSMDNQQTNGFGNTGTTLTVEAVKAFFDRKKHIAADVDPTTQRDKLPKKVTISKPLDREYVIVRKRKTNAQ